MAEVATFGLLRVLQLLFRQQFYGFLLKRIPELTLLYLKDSGTSVFIFYLALVIIFPIRPQYKHRRSLW